jgi:Protein of unknown function (DUF1329)
MRYLSMLALAALISAVFPFVADAAAVKPGEVITPDNAAAVADLVSPGNLFLVKQGMRMTIVPAARLAWPPPYQSATEKYAPQVRLSDQGFLENYVAGLPFPLLDPNDPQIAPKVMWNFSYRPIDTDDSEIRNVETISHREKDVIAGQPVIHITTAHVSTYSNIGRTEVQPVPTDPDAQTSGIRYRFGAFPVLEPAALRGFGYMRYRYIAPTLEDNIWMYIPNARRIRRGRADMQSDATDASTIDPDSYSGFAAKIEDFNYRLLGIKPMLAVVHAANLPAQACEFDNNRTICPENWEMRQLYIVEATQKPLSWHQDIGSSGLSIPKRIFYIDSEGWFITASDQYSKNGALWKTLALFTAYRDRSAIDAKVAVYPFNRIFQTAMVDEDVDTGFATVSYTPGHDTKEPEGWYINMGMVRPDSLDPHRMAWVGH